MMHGRIHVTEQNAYAGLFLGQIIHSWVPYGIGVLIGLKILPYVIGFLQIVMGLR